MGIVGLETAFPLLYTYLVKPGVISMERLMELLHDAPCRRFNIPTDTGFTVFDLNDSYRVDPADFLSMGRATPFAGWSVQGRCLLTATSEGASGAMRSRLLKENDCETNKSDNDLKTHGWPTASTVCGWRGHLRHHRAGAVREPETHRLFPPPPHLRVRLGERKIDAYL